MTTAQAIRRSTVNELITILGRLDIVPGRVAECYRRDAWNTLADLELGCNCTEAAHTLVLSAEQWLAGVR